MRKLPVKRNGAFTPMDVVEMVPGDVVFLRGGNVVPADCVWCCHRLTRAWRVLWTSPPQPFAGPPQWGPPMLANEAPTEAAACLLSRKRRLMLLCVAHPPLPLPPRLNNLELLQKHGANLWLAHIDQLTGASAGCVAHAPTRYPLRHALTIASRFPRLASVQSDLTSQVEAVNRKRKLDQVEVGPHLTRLESEWVGAVKKNLEIEGHCMRMENECAALQKRLAARGGHG